MDAAGKDGTIRSILSGLNPAGVTVTSFKVPAGAETKHDFLWRVHAAAPAKGTIGVFNRSHYEDVLVVRVKNFVPRSVWSKRYDHIRNLETLLHDEGTRIVKCFLHVSKEEQRSRFQDRIDDPTKRWKFRAGDLDGAEAALAAEQKAVESDRKALAGELAELRTGLERMAQERVGLVGAISPDVLATFDLPAGLHAGPITYKLTPEGRQYLDPQAKSINTVISF